MEIKRLIMLFLVAFIFSACALTQDDASYNCWDYASQGVKCGYK